MIYSDQLFYNEPYYQYNGVKIVSPETFVLTPYVNNPKLLAVILLTPQSIDSTLVFVSAHKVTLTTQVENTDTTSSIDFSTLDYRSGLITYTVLDEQAFAITQSQTITLSDQEAYVAFNVLNDQAHALMEAETIILQQNSAGTVDVTIIPTS